MTVADAVTVREVAGPTASVLDTVPDGADRRARLATLLTGRHVAGHGVEPAVAHRPEVPTLADRLGAAGHAVVRVGDPGLHPGETWGFEAWATDDRPLFAWIHGADGLDAALDRHRTHGGVLVVTSLDDAAATWVHGDLALPGLPSIGHVDVVPTLLGHLGRVAPTDGRDLRTASRGTTRRRVVLDDPGRKARVRAHLALGRPDLARRALDELVARDGPDRETAALQTAVVRHLDGPDAATDHLVARWEATGRPAVAFDAVAALVDRGDHGLANTVLDDLMSRWSDQWIPDAQQVRWAAARVAAGGPDVAAVDEAIAVLELLAPDLAEQLQITVDLDAGRPVARARWAHAGPVDRARLAWSAGDDAAAMALLDRHLAAFPWRWRTRILRARWAQAHDDPRTVARLIAPLRGLPGPRAAEVDALSGWAEARSAEERARVAALRASFRGRR